MQVASALSWVASTVSIWDMAAEAMLGGSCIYSYYDGGSIMWMML